MPLFKTTPEFKKYVIIDDNIRFSDQLQPPITEAEILYMIDLIGQDLYNTLLADYVANATIAGDDTVDITAMEARFQSLLPYIQRPLAYYSMCQGYSQFGVSIGMAGITHSRGENSDPAPKWKLDELKTSFIKAADKFAEALLEFLENNPGTYPEWDASSANTMAEGLIVRTAKIASEDVDINDSRRVFVRMKKRVREIEQRIIRRLICTAQYNQLVTEIQNDAVTAINQALIENLKPIISKMALYYTIPSIRIGISQDGITVFSSNDTVITKSSASKQDIKALMDSLKEGELGYEADTENLKLFLEENIDDYPLIEASECWTSKADPGPKHVVENDPCNPYFSV